MKTPAGPNATWAPTNKLAYLLPYCCPGPTTQAATRGESYSGLLQHISDESLKAVIRAEAGPNAVNAADRMNGRTAWLTVERECQEPMSALHVNSKIIEFNARSRCLKTLASMNPQSLNSAGSVSKRMPIFLFQTASLMMP